MGNLRFLLLASLASLAPAQGPSSNHAGHGHFGPVFGQPAKPGAHSRPLNLDNDRCEVDTDCPPFYFCLGARCKSNYKALDHRQTRYCLKMSKDGSTRIPDHGVCQLWDLKHNRLSTLSESTMRCFPGLGFVCAKAHYSPCTPNYDDDGFVRTGQEFSCPHNFNCQRRRHLPPPGHLTMDSSSVRVCVPQQPREPPEHYSRCGSSFDCGYLPAAGAWARCVRNTCRIRPGQSGQFGQSGQSGQSAGYLGDWGLMA